MNSTSMREDQRIARSRAAALDAAAAVFIERGYTDATMQNVADRAGLVKRTLYNLYPDKAALFRATMERSIGIAEQFTQTLAEEAGGVTNPVDELPQIGVRLAETVVTTRVLGLRRVILMESAQFPDLAETYRDRAPEAVLRALAKMFASLIASGAIRRGDPDVTAEHFAFLVMGADLDRGTFSGVPVSRQRARRRARIGVEAFLRAYAP